MYFDDLQWSSKKLAIISELVVSMANLPHARSKLLFIGMYRDNEIQSVNTHMEVLRRHQNINITNIDLPNLSRNDVAEMTMSEMRLPRRMVVDLSDAIYKKAGQGEWYLLLLDYLSILTFLMPYPYCHISRSSVVHNPTSKLTGA